MTRPARQDLIAQTSTSDASLGSSGSAAESSFGAESSFEVASMSVGWAGSPAAVAAVWCSWLVVGVVIADVLARRGHDRRTMTALGVALGPLLAALALGSARWRSAAIEPIVLDGVPDRGGRRMMVAVGGGGEDVADVESVFDLVGTGQVDLVARVDIEDVAEGERGIANSRTATRAVGALRGAASFVPDHYPRLILVAGPPRTALADFAAEQGYDVVVATGAERDRRSFARAWCRSGGGARFVSTGPTGRSFDVPRWP